MIFDMEFASRLASRIGQRWQTATDLRELDNHLRQDIGLPPAPQPPLPVLRHLGH